MHHPFERIAATRRPFYFWPLLAATVGIMVIFQVTHAPLNTPAAPSGIVSFELAGTVEKARQMVASWDTHTQLIAAFGLGFDYLFMAVYSATIGLACIWSADMLRQRKWPLASLGAPLAWGLGLAALFDAFENIGLLVILFGTIASPWPQIAAVCAVLKFALIFLGLIYAFYGLTIRYTLEPEPLKLRRRNFTTDLPYISLTKPI